VGGAVETEFAVALARALAGRSITRDKFEELCADVWPRACAPCSRSWRTQGWGWRICTPWSSWGGTRVPKIQVSRVWSRAHAPLIWSPVALGVQELTPLGMQELLTGCPSPEG